MQEGWVGRGENAGSTRPEARDVITGVLEKGGILSYDWGCASQ